MGEQRQPRSDPGVSSDSTTFVSRKYDVTGPHANTVGDLGPPSRMKWSQGRRRGTPLGAGIRDGPDEVGHIPAPRPRTRRTDSAPPEHHPPRLAWSRRSPRPKTDEGGPPGVDGQRPLCGCRIGLSVPIYGWSELRPTRACMSSVIQVSGTRPNCTRRRDSHRRASPSRGGRRARPRASRRPPAL